MINVLVDLLGISVLLEQSTKYSCSAHSEDIVGHTGLFATFTVTSSIVTTSTFLGLFSLNTRSRVHSNMAFHDDTVMVKFSNVLA